MPVSLENHDPDLDLTPGTTKSDIVAFLYKNDEYGYSPRDIHDEIDIPHNTAKVTLKRLYDSDYLDKTLDGYYHARTDREDLYRYTAALDGVDRMFATYEEDATDEETAETSEMDSAALADEDIEDAVTIVDSDSGKEDL
ncbi:MarR family transcriptional regulator [Haloarcula laminariae]|uniref:MarR family transcriptional regulator n=1 Tax=Haloarcula laminariae TaxID=2961577 RepID=UPI0021C66817|nr:MarR family transcriptional regulator [Halomicroarcula laminariae]